MKKAVWIGIAIIVVAGIAVGVGVGLYLKNKVKGGGTVPYVTPPVKAACPPSLKGTGSMGFEAQALDPSIIVDRFFNPTGGPTNLFDLLASVDSRVQGINDRWSQFSGCIGNTPTSYSLGTAFASSPTFYAQCAETWSGGSGFDQFAQVGDTTYLYVRGGDTIVAAQIVGNGTFGNVHSVRLWYSVGVQPPRNGSHGVVMVYAEPGTPVFEMSVAGVGIGFCGAQLKSDGTVMNVTGSADGPGCAPTDSACTSANDITTTATCNANVDSFSLPALGRKMYSTFAASAYPGGALNTVTLTTTGNDDCFFGPSTPSV